MRTERALRYLLLRHLEPYESAVPRERFREVTASLRVEACREGFDVSFRRDGELRERRFARNDFTFYARGDRSPESRDLHEALATRNDARARAFAEEVFGGPAPPVAPPRFAPRDPYRVASLLFALALAGALFGAGGLDLATSLGVALWLGAEHAPHGRWLACAGLAGLAWVAPAPAGLLGAVAYALLQGLDPDPRGRAVRIGVCGLAALGAGLRLSPPTLGVAELALCLLAVALAAQRSLYAHHFRAVPLALPFFVAGLALGGELRAAVVGLLGIALGTAGVAWAHRVRPVRSG